MSGARSVALPPHSGLRATLTQESRTVAAPQPPPPPPAPPPPPRTSQSSQENADCECGLRTANGVFEAGFAAVRIAGCGLRII